MEPSEPFQTSAHITAKVLYSAYLDDLCLAASESEALNQLVGVTATHFEWWGVKLNLEKSSASCNVMARNSGSEGHRVDLALVDSQTLLGALAKRRMEASAKLDRLALLRAHQGCGDSGDFQVGYASPLWY